MKRTQKDIARNRSGRPKTWWNDLDEFERATAWPMLGKPEASAALKQAIRRLVQVDGQR